MKVVRTVLGDIAPDALGITAGHEHLWCDQNLCRDGNFPRRVEKMCLRDLDLVVAEVLPFHAAGGRAIIEVTVAGWGRDVAVLAEISRRAGVHVVATAGYYVESCLPRFARDADIGRLEQALVDEVTQGADGTTIRCGLLKAAVSRAVLEGVEERCTRAVARAHHRTGAAITTHTSASSRFHIPGGNAGEQFLDVFEAERVDPARIIIGHCDENADIRQLERLARRGAIVQFDVIGKSHWMLDETRADLVAGLLDRGHAERLLLSTDRNRVSELHVRGGPGYDHVLTRFVPLLKARGADEATLHRLLVDNPARIFAMPADAMAETNA
jgi:phosphotriesterase-related protein